MIIRDIEIVQSSEARLGQEAVLSLTMLLISIRDASEVSCVSLNILKVAHYSDSVNVFRCLWNMGIFPPETHSDSL